MDVSGCVNNSHSVNLLQRHQLCTCKGNKQLPLYCLGMGICAVLSTFSLLFTLPFISTSICTLQHQNHQGKMQGGLVAHCTWKAVFTQVMKAGIHVCTCSIS